MTIYLMVIDFGRALINTSTCNLFSYCVSTTSTKSRKPTSSPCFQSKVLVVVVVVYATKSIEKQKV